MESAIILALLILAIILLGPWVIGFRALRKARRNAELADERWNILKARLDTAEASFKELKSRFAKLETSVAGSGTTAVTRG